MAKKEKVPCSDCGHRMVDPEKCSSCGKCMAAYLCEECTDEHRAYCQE